MTLIIVRLVSEQLSKKKFFYLSDYYKYNNFNNLFDSNDDKFVSRKFTLTQIHIKKFGLYNSLRELRQEINQNFKIYNFNFLRLNEPVGENEERETAVKNVIFENNIVEIIQKIDVLRCGIISISKEIFGFIFVKCFHKANEIREIIEKELKDILKSKKIQNNFVLLDSNGWPITQQQECELSFFDLVNDNVIGIMPLNDDSIKNSHKKNISTQTFPIDALSIKDVQTQTFSENFSNSNYTNIHNLNDDNLGLTQSDVIEPIDNEINKIDNSNIDEKHIYNHLHHYSNTYDYNDHHINSNHSSLPINHNLNFFLDSNLNKNLSNIYSTNFKDVDDKTIVKYSSINPKPILISYVRKEAEQHARKLKSQLNNLGCDVFLDIDEIAVGNDWQDSLNNAVANCEIFVPLITPNYGLTLWTNREIKYADVKEKTIVPINFLKTWPPECLAIQFATTQFLPWKTKEEIEQAIEFEGNRATDIRYWDDRFIFRTAKQIFELIKKKSLVNSFINTKSCLTKNHQSYKSFYNHLSTSEEKPNDLVASTLEKIDISEFKESISIKENKQNLTEKKLIEEDETGLNFSYNNKENEVFKLDQNSSTKNVYNKESFNFIYSSIDTIDSISSDKKNRNESNLPKITCTLKKSFIKRQLPYQTNKQKMLIVISAHPAQIDLVEELKAKLSKIYEVYCSTDIFKNLPSNNTKNLKCKDSPILIDKLDSQSSLNSIDSCNSLISNFDSDQSLNQKSITNTFSNELDSNSINNLKESTYTKLNENNDLILTSKNKKDNKKITNQTISSIKSCKSQWYIENFEAMQSSSLDLDEINKVNFFKQKVNKARIIIIILSQAYCESKRSKRQAFYCDLRKQILPVNLENVNNMPHWMSKLIISQDLISKTPEMTTQTLIEKIYLNLDRMIKCNENLHVKLIDEHTRKFSDYIEHKLLKHKAKNIFVYVVGSAQLKKTTTRALCEKIGQCLASKKKIVLVTGGTLGVAQIVAESFFKQRQKLKKINQLNNSENKFCTTSSENDANGANISKKFSNDNFDCKNLDVLHILPKCNIDNLKEKYCIDENGNLQSLPFGQTIYLGNNLQERDSTVARVFPYCILIEGGASSSKLAQEFIYNENIVIPVCNTGGAASGRFIPEEDCGNNITEIPTGVNECDWFKLNNCDLQDDQLGDCIYNIIDSLTQYRENKRCKLLQEFNKNRCKEKNNFSDDKINNLVKSNAT